MNAPTSLYNQLKTIALRWMESGWQKTNLEVFDKLHTPQFTNHGSSGGGANLSDFKRGIRELYEGFPDFFAAVEDIIIDERAQKVAIRWKGVGTHQGTIAGLRPTSKKVTFLGIDILRIENGKVMERWGESNAAEVLGQLHRC